MYNYTYIFLLLFIKSLLLQFKMFTYIVHKTLQTHYKYSKSCLTAWFLILNIFVFCMTGILQSMSKKSMIAITCKIVIKFD